MRNKAKVYDLRSSTYSHSISDITGNWSAKEKTLAKPFVKWVGGKRSIISELENRLPDSNNSYYEPFVGGGALFFSVQPEKAYLSDANEHLVNAYLAVRDDLGRLLRNLRIHETKHSKDYFFKTRERLAKESDPVKVAAILIYLNKTCFNGLYRVNQSGTFNVPMGDYKNPLIVDSDNLNNVSKLLQNTTIKVHSFDKTPIKKGAFYYLDPPYHKTFSSYQSKGFGDQSHEDLADFCNRIHEEDAYFMLSNSDTPFIRKLYKKYKIETVAALRTVSCKSAQRGRENECVIRNY